MLAASSFFSQAELDRLVADKSLAIITNCILAHPETHSGIHLRRFVLALYNGHHAADESRL